MTRETLGFITLMFLAPGALLALLGIWGIVYLRRGWIGDVFRSLK